MRHPGYLFCEVSWHDVERHQMDQMRAFVVAMQGDALLNTSSEDLVLDLINRFEVVVPTLQVDEISVDQKEKQIDVSRDTRRMIFDRTKPFHITGTEVEVEVPFFGDKEVFKIQPTSYTLNPPRGEIKPNAIVLTIIGTDLQADAVRAEINRSVQEIEGNLATLRGNVSSLNTHLPEAARTAIAGRKSKLLADRNLVGGLGFKIKQRPDGQKTFAAPEVRRIIAPSIPVATSAPYKPEPVLESQDYEHILKVLQSMALVMERSPSAFEVMGEEDLRMQFLVSLNSHFEGQATGETFNAYGKADILIRSGDKNIFIAECKFWGGPKNLVATIEQLLGYSSWRDTKVAVVVFNRNKDFSKVLDAIPSAVKSHPNYKRDLAGSSDTVFRYCFAHKDDKNRELFLTVLAFDVPTKDAKSNAAAT